MNNFHISEDGVARRCKAETPESCRATQKEFKQHYETQEEAQKAYETQEMENLFNSIEKEPTINQTVTASTPSPSPQETELTNKSVVIQEETSEEKFAKKQSRFNKIGLNGLYSKDEMHELEDELNKNSVEIKNRIKNSLSKAELLKNLEYRSNNAFNILYNHANLENHYSTLSLSQEYRKKKNQDKKKVMKAWQEEHKIVKKFIKLTTRAHKEQPTRETRNDLSKMKSRAETLEGTIYDMKRGIFSWE